ncbi:MAG: hypothetical protein E7Z76_01340 [Methanobrevibacter sp.]|jgi:hypothetical protein|nr:hypothetical protein [Methanobrevibacter sp.]
MDLKKIGILLIFVGVVISIVFVNTREILIPGLTITVIGFFITLLGFIGAIKRRKIVSDRLNDDVVTILQPLITKYSNLNKQYKQEYSDEEYSKKRLELNKSLEKEISQSLPYLESREIKNIVIQFSKEQDKMN